MSKIRPTARKLRGVLLLAALGLGAWAAPAAAAVVGVWQLNEGFNPDGSPVQDVLDSSGNGYHGFLGFNATVETADAPRSADAQGRSGTSGDYALSYPVGANAADFAGIPDNAAFNPTQFTLAADIDPGTFRQSVVAGKHGGGTTGSYFLGFSGTDPTATNNSLRFVVITVDNSDPATPVYTRVNLDTPILVTDGTDGYHQFVGTYDGSTMRLYYDGVLRAEAAHTRPGPVRDVNRRLLFGDYSDFGQNSFEYEGLVDNPALFDTALGNGGVAVGQPAAPGSEIHQLFTQGAISFVPEPGSLALLGVAGLTLLRRRARA